MKTYTCSVSVDSFDKHSSLIDSFINEGNENKKQAKLSERINEETTKLHRQILTDFVDEINKQLEKINLSFTNLSYNTKSNEYRESYATCEFRIGLTTKVYYILNIIGIMDREFKDSKYSTYTGNYDIRIKRSQTYFNRDIILVEKIKNIDDALNYMKDDIINYITNYLK